MSEDNINIALTELKGQFNVIDTKLDGIDVHLKKINGTVEGHTEKLNQFAIERESLRIKQDVYFKDLESVTPRIRMLEDEHLSTKAIKKWIVGSVAIMTAVLGIIYTLHQMIG